MQDLFFSQIVVQYPQPSESSLIPSHHCTIPRKLVFWKPSADVTHPEGQNLDARSYSAKGKTRGALLLVLPHILGVLILATPPKTSISFESPMSDSDTPSSSKYAIKTNCKANKRLSADGEMSGLSMPSAASGTKTINVHVSQPSDADGSIEDITATPASSQFDPLQLSFNDPPTLSPMINACAAGSMNSSDAAYSAPLAMPLPALCPVHTYEVPYAVSGANTSYLNATVTTNQGLSFLLSTYSSTGAMHTTNMGTILPGLFPRPRSHHRVT